MGWDGPYERCVSGSCDVKLHLQCICPPHVYFQTEWLVTIVGYESSRINKTFHYLMSFNGGVTWKKAPASNSAIRSFNEGGIIVSLNKTTRQIIYSFDEGKTYYYMDIFQEKVVIIDAVHAGKTDTEKMIIFGRNQEKNIMVIANIDFTTITSIYINNQRKNVSKR
ncbi:Vacuolar protein sorting/targeting protein 10 [Thelohanellus kitauei]|uniref:Vacuolar protein sorting/targeting protein 10 n=1 Tax=Thelohanellus kitauei TaxID=669202 RepID=A0A0C2N5U5_THEKT|nr:Vacuolar protein sorting/targeting protein 10 [Thelohanellus kitauei]